VHPSLDVRIFHKECKTLVHEKHEVILIAQHDKDEEVEGVHIRALEKPKNRVERMTKTLWKTYRKAIKEDAQIYHFHDPELIPVALLLKIFIKAKIIYDVHEDVPEDIISKQWLPGWSRKYVAFGYKCFERFTCKFIDGIVGATDSIAARFPPNKTMAVRNYPILDFFSDGKRNDESVRKEYYFLVSTGSLVEERGIYELVRSLELVDKQFAVHLKLLGRFGSEAFQNKVNSLKGFSSVNFLGWVSYPEATKHLKEADIGVVLFHPVPNNIRAMPNKLFEYMAAGLPVIASHFPLWKEIVVGNGCGLIVNPLNPREIAEAIEYLIANPEVRRLMGRNGKRAALERYNWDCEAKKLLGLYAYVTKGGELMCAT
jgi:glycosyltransferase involved in cell wall biosynthesis